VELATETFGETQEHCPLQTWSYEEESVWIPYAKEVAEKLEKAYQAEDAEIVINVADQEATVYFELDPSNVEIFYQHGPSGEVCVKREEVEEEDPEQEVAIWGVDQDNIDARQKINELVYAHHTISSLKNYKPLTPQDVYLICKKFHVSVNISSHKKHPIIRG